MEDSPVEQEARGMGVRNHRYQNRGLLFKWLWRFNQNERALWKVVVTKKYGGEHNWSTKITNSAHGVVSVWKHIRSFWDDLGRNTDFGR